MRDETKCSSCVGWSYEEKLLHIAPSGAQCRLLSSYKLNLDRGVDTVRRLILADVARFQEMGAQKYADDLKIVLACFAAECLSDASDCQEKPAPE
ncbi:hypothetical protein [Methylocystis sp. B8]|uniref:hypothetical protein n=1 Tax=Methylocystis sp. B8 TaxID=544938 RepID=UPI0010FD927E|nr:hypothetical protein [Methylocystis sp. B8]TLG77808.1 hypothetical protein FEV16_08285 [Methylocystis sp. B8]